jgi:hypothetical protein
LKSHRLEEKIPAIWARLSALMIFFSIILMISLLFHYHKIK